jgi:hypothetical protein
MGTFLIIFNSNPTTLASTLLPAFPDDVKAILGRPDLCLADLFSLSEVSKFQVGVATYQYQQEPRKILSLRSAHTYVGSSVSINGRIASRVREHKHQIVSRNPTVIGSSSNIKPTLPLC